MISDCRRLCLSQCPEATPLDTEASGQPSRGALADRSVSRVMALRRGIGERFYSLAPRQQLQHMQMSWSQRPSRRREQVVAERLRLVPRDPRFCNLASCKFKWFRQSVSTHNPKVAGSNPAPATTQEKGFRSPGGPFFCAYKRASRGGPDCLVCSALTGLADRSEAAGEADGRQHRGRKPTDLPSSGLCT